MTTVPPIRREVLVDADPAAAFEVFTEGVGRWWPTEKSVYGPGGTVAFTDRQIVERSADGQRAVWGTVTRWEPPAALSFTWHPGREPDRASHVDITFTAAGAQTLVAVRHSGWEAFDDPAAARAEYEQGWPLVLGSYRDHAGQRGDHDGDTWVALMHRPGPAAPQNGSVIEDPRFAEHVAFIDRMRDAGYLVAAGPLDDAAGEGMTILRLPGAGQLERAVRLATEDDRSVAGGFLAVAVRPWQVMVHTPTLTSWSSR
ncbi:MAG TPA: SRPBCC domain-containing protein [Streptosporangiaceae bacterium]|nr:SRPBCC domain-containing protein [Streptosporangiaceae bacterium]